MLGSHCAFAKNLPPLQSCMERFPFSSWFRHFAELYMVLISFLSVIYHFWLVLPWPAQEDGQNNSTISEHCGGGMKQLIRLCKLTGMDVNIAIAIVVVKTFTICVTLDLPRGRHISELLGGA